MDANPYLDAVRRALPRLLSRFDTDRTSESHGLGDRLYWAWGLIDFGNATFQGAAHGLARLWRCGLWPYPTSAGVFVQRIDALFAGAKRLTREDGSLEEAFPREGSFCVTALVAYDLLCAIDLLAADLDAETKVRWKSIIAPMVDYLLEADETHAFISNHLATAAAALVRWHALSGSAASEARARVLIDRILAAQSSEGWFKEYEGTDPGYQSLCTCYLADVHALRPDWGLREPLQRSVRFAAHFAHADGSFGGLYGSRCTRFFYPSGFEALAPEMEEAAALALHMAAAITGERVVGLSAIDEPNLVPMFNAYCRAAELRARGAPTSRYVLPALRHEAMHVAFAEAGIVVDAGPRHYTIVSTHKGGVVAHFVDGRASRIDAGVVVRGRAGRLGSSQTYAPENVVRMEADALVVESRIRPMPRRLPSPADFIVLRLLCVSAFRLPRLREWVKRRLVRMLIGRQEAWPATNVRRIAFGPELAISDETRLPEGYVRLEAPGPFVAIHMASQGYWQLHDETDPR
jgi:hypothetical protein